MFRPGPSPTSSCALYVVTALDGDDDAEGSIFEDFVRFPRNAERVDRRFFGSGDHAQAAANIFSLIASCVLHRLHAEGYLADVIRVLPYLAGRPVPRLAPKSRTGPGLASTKPSSSWPSVT